MFRCHRKKFNWYIKKGLAELVEGREDTIRLLFQPNGLGWAGEHYFLQDRDNKCCCCGTSQNLTKHHVIPYSYRKHLPIEIKESNYYDVLPLCVECHNRYEIFARDKKKELAERYNAPIQGINNFTTSTGPCFAKTLLQHGNVIPDGRKQQMLEYIEKEFGKKNLTPKDLKEIASLKEKGKQRSDYKSHAEIVVSSIESYQKFFKEWREHFVTHMQPKCLPKCWEIERDLHGRTRKNQKH